MLAGFICAIANATTHKKMDCADTLAMTGEDLDLLVKRAFSPEDRPQQITIFIDLPLSAELGNTNWTKRIEMAKEWQGLLQQSRPRDTVRLVAYSVVPANNAPLPSTGWEVSHRNQAPKSQQEMSGEATTPISDVLAASDIVYALTEKSATAPLKLAAKELQYRGATSGRFKSEMIPALKIPFHEVHKKCQAIADVLQDSVGAEIRFQVMDENALPKEYKVYIDLRYRKAHISSGLINETGTVGNLPSGETYITPYEGEKSGIPSMTSGVIPVQFGDEIVLFKVENNQTTEILSDGPRSKKLWQEIVEEPARGNIAELGLGVLDGFGIKPVGEILLDEKLGLHIAWGMSNHLGGSIGPDAFKVPQQASHQDRVYIHSLQPRVMIRSLNIQYTDKPSVLLMENGSYHLPE